MSINDNEIRPPASLASSKTQQVWDLRLQGFSIHEISAQLGLPLDQISDLLCEHHRQRQAEPIEAKSFYRDLASSRVDALLKVYLPIALMDSVSIKRLRCGEPIEEQSLDHPLHCAAFCLAALKFQAELLGLRNLEPARIAGTGAQDVLSWLHNQTEFIKQIAREAPPDVVTLPTEQLDGPQSPATEMKTLGSQTYRDKLRSEAFELDVDIDEIEIPVARAPTTGTLGGDPSGPVEDPLEAERRERRERFFRGECDAL
jgi:hypothetical protein